MIAEAKLYKLTYSNGRKYTNVLLNITYMYKYICHYLYTIYY